MSNLFTKEELIQLNERMLGRGAPVQDDGVGYNKADYGACSNYFYGCSDAQLADLSKRLMKYCNTQLGLNKEDMKATHEHFAELAGSRTREEGISLNITENGTLISFKYNERFVEVVKKQPRRQYDRENKNWIVPNDRIIPTLNELFTVGADVSGALKYASNHELVRNAIIKKVEVEAKFQDGKVLLKFPYNKDVVETIKEIDRKERTWNSEFKFWTIEPKHLDTLKTKLTSLADFKVV